jgi:hypothetical protein
MRKIRFKKFGRVAWLERPNLQRTARIRRYNAKVAKTKLRAMAANKKQ